MVSTSLTIFVDDKKDRREFHLIIIAAVGITSRGYDYKYHTDFEPVRASLIFAARRSF